MTDLYVARGHASTLGSVKETSYGAGGTPNLWHIFDTLGLKFNDAAIALTGSRGQNDTAYPGTGGRTIDGSVSLESTVDTIPFWLAMAMAQNTPSTTIVNTTASGAVSSGATSGTLTSGLNVFPGMKLTWGTAQVTVKSISGSTVTFTAGISASQTSGCTVTCTATNAYLSKFTVAFDLPSFLLQINRFGPTAGSSFAAEDIKGCMVESLAFALAKGICRITPTINAQDFVSQSAPTAATVSTKNPFLFEQQFTPAQWNATVIGTGTEASVISVQATLNNALDKGKFSLGNGNLQRKPQKGLSSVSGSLALDFASTTARDAFNAAHTGGQKPPVALTIPIAGTDIADATNGVPYALTIVLPKIYLSAWDGGDKGSAALQQSVSFSAHPSGVGTNDSITVYSIGTNPSAY